MLKLLPSPAAALSVTCTKLIFPQCPFGWHVCQCIGYLHFSRYSTVSLSLSPLLYLLLSSTTPTQQQSPPPWYLNGFITPQLHILLSHHLVTFNIFLYYLKADVIPCYIPLLLLLANSFVPFFALPMAFTSSNISEFFTMSALHPQLFVNAFFWISGSCTVVSESLAYLVARTNCTAHQIWKKPHWVWF